MHFEWDESKRAANLAKHRLDFADVDRLEWSAMAIVPASPLHGEERLQAFGLFEERLHVVTFTVRDGAYRIISFRSASRKERKQYGAAAP